MAKIKKAGTEKHTGKMILSGMVAALLVVLVIIAACFIAHGAGVAPEPVSNVINNLENELSGAGIHIPFIGTTGEAIVEPEEYEPITTPYEEPTPAAVTDGGITPGAVTGGAITGAAVTTAAVTSEAVTEPMPEVKTKVDYSSLYPEMKTKYPDSRKTYTNVVFLTFDDGPCSNTEEVLDTLAEYDVKATFFVVGNRMTEATKPIIERMMNEGHTIGVHTTCHQYKTIYASVEAYLDDFNTTYEKIHKYTGTYPNIFRFPGGSINSYNTKTHSAIIDELTRRGFIYYDWNVSAGDATNGATEESILANATRGVKYKDVTKNVIVLMHDISSLTTSQLAGIIEAYQAEGFTFAALDPSVKAIIF